MKIAVFSDLHLGSTVDEKYEYFLDLLKKLRKEKVSEIWFMGDIFDLMVGDYQFWKDIHIRFFVELAAFKYAAIPIVWAEGNHDFHLSKLLSNLNVEVIENESSREISNYAKFEKKRVYLSHGDCIDQGDSKYLKWRKTSRSWYFKSVFLNIPEFYLRKKLIPYIDKVSKKSRKRNQSFEDKQRELTTMFQKFAKSKLDNGHQAVFLGHSHKQELLEYNNGFYLNLGSWISPNPKDWNYALWEPFGESKLPIIL